MLKKLFEYLKKNKINYCITNGYKNLYTHKGDIDILITSNAFANIEKILKRFCSEQNLRIVQSLHHDIYAKNVFLFDPEKKEYLNLDFYGELSRANILLFEESDIFRSLSKYEEIPILSPEKEMSFYLIKKLDKKDLSEKNFSHLVSLYKTETEKCNLALKNFFPTQYSLLIQAFKKNDYKLIQKYYKEIINDFYRKKKFNLKRSILNVIRVLKRISAPTGLIISFLGPDGAGKSTIIQEIYDNNLPFRRIDYFHLKPIIKKNNFPNNKVVENPHCYQPYGKIKSYLKLVYFIFLYNYGWFKNVWVLQRKSSLCIFDRYYDDIIIDPKRYRFGGIIFVAKLARYLIPRPTIYFVLTADAKIIFRRKKEVSMKELKRQIIDYQLLADGKRYYNIDTNKSIEEIKVEVITIIMNEMIKRY